MAIERLKVEEIVTAIELIAEQKEQFTVPQVVQLFLPGHKKGVTRTLEYTRIYRVVTALLKRGDLMKHEPLAGTGSPLFSIAPTGINHDGLETVCPTILEKSDLRVQQRSLPIPIPISIKRVQSLEPPTPAIEKISPVKLCDLKDLRGVIGKAIDALETIQDQIQPLLAKLLDIEKDCSKLEQVQAILLGMRNSLQG